MPYTYRASHPSLPIPDSHGTPTSSYSSSGSVWEAEKPQIDLQGNPVDSYHIQVSQTCCSHEDLSSSPQSPDKVGQHKSRILALLLHSGKWEPETPRSLLDGRPVGFRGEQESLSQGRRLGSACCAVLTLLSHRDLLYHSSRAVTLLRPSDRPGVFSTE